MMDKDNVRLALWIAGIWGGLIILIVGVEAIVHDGDIAATIVDTFSKVLFGLGTILGVITGVGKFFETSQANTAVAVTASAAAAPLAPSEPSEPVSSPGGITAPASVPAAVSGPGVD